MIGQKSTLDAITELDRCLSPAPPSDDFLGLSLGCADTIGPTRCGALLAVGRLRGIFAVKYTVQPLGNRAGPWNPDNLPAVDSGRCNCK
jgi:hypothetical protein